MSAHPSIDSLADHHEGLLSVDLAAGVEAHLTICSPCRVLLSTLDEVAIILAAEGRATAAIPPSVAASLEGAIGRAAAERSTGQVVVPIHGHRDAQPDERRTWRRSWPLLAAAAAVVAVSSIGVELVRDGAGQDSAQSGSAGSAEADRPDSGGAAAAPGGSDRSDTQPLDPNVFTTFPVRLNPSNVLSYADQLAAGRVKPAPVPATCAQSQIDVVGTPTQGLVTYGKQRAVLSLTESARQVTVYACDATAEVLFRDGY